MDLGLDLRRGKEGIVRDIELLEVWNADYRTDAGTVIRVT
jgi:hypothetical protein